MSTVQYPIATEHAEQKSSSIVVEDKDVSSFNSTFLGKTMPPVASHPVDSNKPSLFARAKSSVSGMLQRPTMVKCSGCAQELAVPASVWEWKCSQAHVNDYSSSQCTSCEENRGAVAAPQLQCGSCRTWTAAPSTELMNFVTKNFTMMSRSANDVVAPPSSFHCGSCNTLLVNPHEKDAWKCQKCTVSNDGDRYNCASCTESRPSPVLICGSCQQATAPPATKLVDRAKSMIRKLSVESEKAFLKGTGTAHVQCPTCDKPVTLPKFHAGGASAPSSGTNTPRSTSTSAAGVVDSSSSASRPANWSLDLTCSGCGNNFQLMNEEAASSQNVTDGPNVRRQFLPATTISNLEKAQPQL